MKQMKAAASLISAAAWDSSGLPLIPNNTLVSSF